MFTVDVKQQYNNNNSAIIERSTYLATLTPVYRIAISAFLKFSDKNNINMIMKVMQKLKFILEFTFAINVECLNRNLVANTQLRTCKAWENMLL